MRARALDDFVGQGHLLGEGSALRSAIEEGRPHSMVLYGPPGTGKTTLARLLARNARAAFEEASAVNAGKQEVRDVLERAEHRLRTNGEGTVFFLDEIHRFNKAQQDALLPAVEEGWIALIGATTENPSFEVIPPLLSRAAVFTLKSLDEPALELLIERALSGDSRFAGITIEDRDLLKLLSGGDGRKLLTGLELALDLMPKGSASIDAEMIRGAFSSRQFYDKAGEMHYDIISGFIKSMKGSDPDAALFYLARMIESGEDPLFIARRMVVLASEDIGNADPYAITFATN